MKGTLQVVKHNHLPSRNLAKSLINYAVPYGLEWLLLLSSSFQNEANFGKWFLIDIMSNLICSWHIYTHTHTSRNTNRYIVYIYTHYFCFLLSYYFIKHHISQEIIPLFLNYHNFFVKANELNSLPRIKKLSFEEMLASRMGLGQTDYVLQMHKWWLTFKSYNILGRKVCCLKSDEKLVWLGLCRRLSQCIY